MSASERMLFCVGRGAGIWARNGAMRGASCVFPAKGAGFADLAALLRVEYRKLLHRTREEKSFDPSESAYCLEKDPISGVLPLALLDLFLRQSSAGTAAGAVAVILLIPAPSQCRAEHVCGCV